MTLYFEEEGSLELPLNCEELASKVIEAALDYVECPYDAEVNLLLTMNEEIHEMNMNFRQIDRPTDVLSFPMVDYEEVAEYEKWFAYYDYELYYPYELAIWQYSCTGIVEGIEGECDLNIAFKDLTTK